MNTTRNDKETAPFPGAPGRDGEPIPVVMKKIDGYRVYQRGDGDRYWRLFRAFARGEVEHTRLGGHAKERDVFLLVDAGRKYVLKLDRGGWGFGGESPVERFLLKLLRGPFYSRLMRRVRAARDAGCEVIQDVHLVAERRTLHYCHEAAMIMDYIEGEELALAPDPSAHYPAMREAILSLHRHNLALCDISYYNFLITERGVRMIDLVCRGNPRVDRIKDAIRMKKVFGIDLPVEGRLDGMIYRILKWFQTRRERRAEKRRALGTPRRERYFRTYEEEG